MRPSPPQEEQVYRLDPQTTDPQAWNRCWMGNQPAALRCSYHDKGLFFLGGHFSPIKFSAIVRHKKRPKRPQCLKLSHFALGHTVVHGLFEMFEMKHCLQCNCNHSHSLRDLERQTLFKLFVLESVTVLNVFMTCQPIH